MSTTCAAYKCPQRSGRKARDQGITFHCLPKDAARRKEWALALRFQVNGKVCIPKHKTCICSRHFTADCFDRTGQTTRLRDGAVPSIFDFPHHMTKKVGASALYRNKKQQNKNGIGEKSLQLTKQEFYSRLGLVHDDSRKKNDVTPEVSDSNPSVLTKYRDLAEQNCDRPNSEKDVKPVDIDIACTTTCLPDTGIQAMQTQSSLLNEKGVAPCRKRSLPDLDTGPREIKGVPTPVKVSCKDTERQTSGGSSSSDKPERLKRVYIVAAHPRSVMYSLALLWKDGKFCDAGIGNETTTVMVHKVVLLAMCPKLLSMSSDDVSSSRFLRVNFPKGVGQEALNAFADYIYNGVLDLDHQILSQLRIIALCLEMKELKMLCDAHLTSPNSLTVAHNGGSSTEVKEELPVVTSDSLCPRPRSHDTPVSISLNTPGTAPASAQSPLILSTSASLPSSTNAPSENSTTSTDTCRGSTTTGTRPSESQKGPPAVTSRTPSPSPTPCFQDTPAMGAEPENATVTCLAASDSSIPVTNSDDTRSALTTVQLHPSVNDTQLSAITACHNYAQRPPAISEGVPPPSSSSSVVQLAPHFTNQDEKLLPQ